MKVLILFFGIILNSPCSEPEAMKLMQFGCRQKNALGCFNYANMLLNIGKKEDAQKYFARGCKLGLLNACEKKTWKELEAIKK